MNPQGHMGPASSLDEMFSRKRGRPPKNRVVEVWADHVSVCLYSILILDFLNCYLNNINYFYQAYSNM